MAGLDANLVLPLAGRYPHPRNSAEALPLVYGRMIGGQGGLWKAVCIDRQAFVYALAGHALTPPAPDNPVTLYDGDGAVIDPGDYQLFPAQDYLGRGVVATARFRVEARDREPIAVRAHGKPGPDGAPLTNPLDLARDLLVAHGGLAPDCLDPGLFSRARSRATLAGYRAAGVIGRSVSLAQILTGLLGEFLGSWWWGGDGRLRLSLDLTTGGLDDGELAGALSQSQLSEITVTANLADVVNQLEILHAYNPLTQEAQAAWSGPAGVDRRSQGLYGVRRQEINLQWVREDAVAAALAARLVKAFAFPRRTITCQEGALVNLPLERGDAALLSLDWLCDPRGQPLVNQIVRVLGMEPDLDRGSVTFSLLDTGCYRTLTHPADGACLADGGRLAGGERDTREFPI